MDLVRVSTPIGPNIDQTRMQNFQFPANPSFENPLVGIESNIYGFFNFLLKDGSKSSQDTKKTDTTLKMIEGVARRIDCYHEELEQYGQRVNCIMVYDKNS